MQRRLGLLVWMVLALSLPLLAQTATISGRVVDEADAVLPGVSVTVKNQSTGISREGVTNSEGLYTVPALTPGRYTVAGLLTGFARVERANIELLTGADRKSTRLNSSHG